MAHAGVPARRRYSVEPDRGEVRSATGRRSRTLRVRPVMPPGGRRTVTRADPDSLPPSPRSPPWAFSRTATSSGLGFSSPGARGRRAARRPWRGSNWRSRASRSAGRTALRGRPKASPTPTPRRRGPNVPGPCQVSSTIRSPHTDLALAHRREARTHTTSGCRALTASRCRSRLCDGRPLSEISH